jgi:hypothetical protein
MARPTSTCSVAGCDRTHFCRSFCRLHFERWKRHGDPLALRRRRSDYQRGIKTCEFCGVVFERPPGWPAPAWRRTRFCSIACGAKGRGKHKLNTLDEFFDAAIPEPNSGCWLWTGTLHRDGYGQISIGGKVHRAHRLAYEVVAGPVPDGLGVLHRCDVRCCVNPDHLYAGTPAENSADAVRRGRVTRGTLSPHAKLTDDDVRTIRSSTQSIADIAQRFGVSTPVVRKIRNGSQWRHVQ